MSLTNYTYAQIFENVTVLEADSIIKTNAENEIFTIMDVRTLSEYNRDHLENAYQRNFYDADFREQMDSLAKKRIYLIYCQSGNRSGQSFNIMKELGFEHVYNMLGGISMWKNMGLPVTTDLPPDIDLYEEVTSTYHPSDFGIKVYPNPFIHEITMENLLPNSEVSFFDMTGKLIYQSKLKTNIFQYKFEQIPSGLILQIYHPEYKGRIVQKLLKQ